MGETAIREAAPGDRPALVGFMAGLQDYECDLHPDRAEAAAMADGHLAYLEQLVAERQGFILVAEAPNKTGGESGGETGAELAGFLVALVEDLDPRDGHIAEPLRRNGTVTDIYVRPAARRGGIGAALLEAAERRFRDMGLRRMLITMLAANEAAGGLYRQVGFRPYELTLEKPL